MEPRESSSLSTSINREATTNEYCAISAAAVLAKDAALLFKSQKFAECFDVLHQISQRKQHDLKVLHNMAITEYLRDGRSDPHKLLEMLNNVRQRSQEIAHASREKLDDLPDGKLISNVKGTNFIEPPQGSSFSSIIYRDECDSFIATSNMATIWFHHHEYRRALSILEPLFQNIDPVDEKTALHICLLLLDVSLACNDAHKTAEVIIYMEKAFGVTTPQRTDLPSPSTPKPGPLPPLPTTPPSAPTDAMNLDPSPTPDVSEDALYYDTLFSTLDSGVAGGPHPSPSADPPKRHVISMAELKLKFQLYRVRLLLLTKNLKAAKREVKLTMNLVRGGADSSAALVLKSRLEYTRGNHRKAVKLLLAAAASGGRLESETSVAVDNNLGCIYYQLGKPHTASIFFSRSRPEKSPPLLYNRGIQYLACGKPDSAAACFRRASASFADRPLFWLRIAECCLMAEGGRCQENVVRVLGHGIWRRLSIGRSPSPAAPLREESSMAAARCCLLTALYLLGLPPAGKTKGKTPVSANGVLLQASVSEHESYCRQQEGKVKQAALAAIAYVELELGDPLASLAHSGSLLCIPDCSKIYLFLGRVYSAEALILLNRIEEAAEQLRVYLMEDDGVRPPFSGLDSDQWTAEMDPEEARGILNVDLAAMYAAQGDLEKAAGFLSKVPSAVSGRYPEAVGTGVYVDLMMEKKEEALRKLRCWGKCAFFQPASVMENGV